MCTFIHMKRWTAFDRALLVAATDWLIVLVVVFVVCAVYGVHSHITLHPYHAPFVNLILG